MTKHVLDRPRAPTEARAQKYLQAERGEGLHPSTKALIRRDRTQGGARTQAFMKIAKAGGGEG